MGNKVKSNKDWTGSSRAPFVTIGAKGHAINDREKHDYYATDPVAIDMLNDTGFFDNVEKVWEPACGGGHLSKKMEAMGLDVVSTDLYDQGFGESGVDFLRSTDDRGVDAIVTNPPYKEALEFCQKCSAIKVKKYAMFLKLTFLEGQKRKKFFDKYPPKYVAVCVNRLQCALNGDEKEFEKSSAACYAWFIWEKGYKGKPRILWLMSKGNKNGSTADE